MNPNGECFRRSQSVLRSDLGPGWNFSSDIPEAHSSTPLSVCLFLSQIHSIIPDCFKHSTSSTFHFPLQQGSTSPFTCPPPTHPIWVSIISLVHGVWFEGDFSRPSLFWGIRVTLDEGEPSDAHLAGTFCGHKPVKAEISFQLQWKK